MSRPLSATTAIRVIRFTRRIARQCSLHGWPKPDQIVCDTIANGSRHVVRRRGSRGGPLIRFERAYGPDGAPNAPEGSEATVRVLGELTPAGCVALQLLYPPPRQESRKMRDF